MERDQTQTETARKTVTEVSVWSSAFSLSTQDATPTVLPHAMMSVGTRVVCGDHADTGT